MSGQYFEFFQVVRYDLALREVNMKVNCFSTRLAVAVLLWTSYVGQSVNAASDYLVLAENNKTVVIIQTDKDSRNPQDNNRRFRQDNQTRHRDNYDIKQRENDHFLRNHQQDKPYRHDDDRYSKDRPQYQQHRKHEDNDRYSQDRPQYQQYRKHDNDYKRRPNHRKRHAR